MAGKKLLDPSFIYRNAANTDVRRTFERVRREQQEAMRKRELSAVTGNPSQRSAPLGSKGPNRP